MEDNKLKIEDDEEFSAIGEDARDGTDMDENSQFYNPDKVEVAGIFERNQNQNF